ncbi:MULTISPECIES: hypothetical protein [unclassified Sinorhizobium]|uniref:hypothetical protein n=1 Tax=unclassified Sinorhizobium TaxID=2613772 RepID=UPI0035233C36
MRKLKDVAEGAAVTKLQALSCGKELVLLPFSMRLGIQDVDEPYDCERGPLNVRQLEFSLLVGSLQDWTAPLRAAQRT